MNGSMRTIKVTGLEGFLNEVGKNKGILGELMVFIDSKLVDELFNKLRNESNKNRYICKYVVNLISKRFKFHIGIEKDGFNRYKVHFLIVENKVIIRIHQKESANSIFFEMK